MGEITDVHPMYAETKDYKSMNEYGTDGWELVAVIKVGDTYKAIFKRRIQTGKAATGGNSVNPYMVS